MLSDEPVGIRSTKWGIHKDKQYSAYNNVILILDSRLSE